MLKRLKRAFTIMELVVVIAVIAILAAVLIPTFSNVVQNAKVSNDTQTASTLNVALAAYNVEDPITSEDDLRAAVDGTYGEGYYDSLEPESAEYGYHFWYNTETNRIELSRSEDLGPAAEGAQTQKASAKIAASAKTAEFRAEGMRGALKEGYVLLDRSGSTVADTLKQLDTLATADDYMGAITGANNLSDDSYDSSLASNLNAALSATVIITNSGAFRYENGATQIQFASGITTIVGTIYVYHKTNQTVTQTMASETNSTVNYEGDITLPESVTLVDSYGLYFENGDSVTLTVPSAVNNDEEMTDFFSANATNAKISRGGVETEYKIDGDKLLDDNNQQVGKNLTVANPLKSFEIYKDGKSANPNEFVAYDTETVAYTIDKIEGEYTDKPVSAPSIIWTVSDDTAATVENGVVTFKPDSTADKITLTAKSAYGSTPIEKSVTINIVRVRDFTLTLNGLECGNDKVVTIPYKEADEQQFEAAFSYNFDTLTTNPCNPVLNYEITDENTAGIKIEDGVLTYETYGSADITATVVGTNISKSFTILVATDESYFESKFTNNYLYRVGNENSFTLDTIFQYSAKNEIPEELDNYTLGVTFYNASQTTAEGNKGYEVYPAKEDIAGNLKVTITGQDNATDLSKLTVQFSGEGVAIIEVYIINENLHFGALKQAVEVVNGQNVSATTGTLGAQNNNDILLSDITVNNAATFTNANLYGNGFAIHAESYSSSNSGGIINLNNSNIDNIRLYGMVFPNVVYSGNDYFNNAVEINGGNCTISNSYISDCRSAIRVYNANSVTFDNTVIDGGTYANVEIRSKTNIVLSNVTTVQATRQSTNPTGEKKTVIGLGFVFESSAIDSNVTIIGDLRQYNWVCKDDTDILSQYSGAWSNIINVGELLYDLFAEGSAEYGTIQHNVNGTVYINTGFIFLGNGSANFNLKDATALTSEAKYATVTKTISSYTGTVYTYSSNSPVSNDDLVTANRFTYNAADYVPNAQTLVEPTFTYTFKDEVLPDDKNSPYHYYDETTNTLHIGVTNDQNYTFNPFEGVKISKYGREFDVLTSNPTYDGKPLSAGDKITFTKDKEHLGIHEITFTVSDSDFYQPDGQPISNAQPVTYTFTLYVQVEAANRKSATIEYDQTKNNVIYATTTSWGDSDYNPCAELLAGLTITDYNSDDSIAYEFNGGGTSIPEGLVITVESSNPSNMSFTLRTYNGKLYLCGSTFANYKSNDHQITVKYSYTGLNGATSSTTMKFTFKGGTDIFNNTIGGTSTTNWDNFTFVQNLV